MSGLPDAVVAVVEELGEAHVHSLSTAYRSAKMYTAGAAAIVRLALPDSQRDHVDPLNRAWAATPDMHGASIALAL